MPVQNLKALDLAELMPLHDVPDSDGPRNEEEQRIYELVKEGLNSGPGITYEAVADFMRALDTHLPR